MTLREISKKTWEDYFALPRDEPAGDSLRATFPVEHNSARQQFSQENFESITVVPQIESHGMNDSVVLRRFMDLPKFIDLIVNQRLVLPTIRKLQQGDPHECESVPDYNGVSVDDLKRQILGLTDYVAGHDIDYWLPRKFDLLNAFTQTRVTEKSLEEVLSKMSEAELRQAAWSVEHKRLQDELCCNCWYGSELESDAMWRLYCDQVGVAITTTVGALRTSVKCEVAKMFKEHFKLTVAKVEYDDSLVVANNPPWLVKRMAFRHEHEFRLFVDYPKALSTGLILTVDPSILIQEMTISPYAMRWQKEAIKAMSRRILGENICIKPSKHRDAKKPSWPHPQDQTGA